MTGEVLGASRTVEPPIGVPSRPASNDPDARARRRARLVSVQHAAQRRVARRRALLRWR